MIYTFYSFKGGVGRSMALANLAEHFYRRNLKVLMVDFDLEAPGLERFFLHQPPAEMAETTAVTPASDEPGSARSTPLELARQQRGMIDMVLSFKTLRSLSIGNAEKTKPEEPGGTRTSGQNPVLFAHPVEPLVNFIYPIYSQQPDGGGALYLIPAGRRAGSEYAEFTERVRTFDWDDFYLNWEGGLFFDWFRNEARSIADVVLIDSRTGITEMSGICTYHLADAVILLAATNEQNLEGTKLIAESLVRRREKESADQDTNRRQMLKMLAVPSRVEMSESPSLKRFKDLFERELGQYNQESGVRFNTNAFDDLKIPYVARYAYFETLAMREPDQPVARDVISAYERLASAMWAIAEPNSAFYRRYYQATRHAQAWEIDLPPLVEDFAGREWVFSQVDNWLATSTVPVMMITGGPGSGKTALARQLVGISQGDVPADPAYPKLSVGWLNFATFGAYTTPNTFLTELAQTLGQLPEYTQVLALGSDDNLKINVQQNIGFTDIGGKVTGVVIESLDLNDQLPWQAAFDLLLSRPLRQLARTNPDFNLRILVDGLDESADLLGNDGFAALLNEMSSLPGVRLLITSRPGPLVRMFSAAETVELDSQADANQADLRAYVSKRINKAAQAIPEGIAKNLIDPKQVIERVLAAAEGNFTYASELINWLFEAPDEIAVRLENPIPARLDDLFRSYLSQVIGNDLKRWESLDRPLLSVLAVAFEPLNLEQLSGATKSSLSGVEQRLLRWRPYLEVEAEPGKQTYRFFHLAFRDFLLQNDEFPLEPLGAHLALGQYLLEEWNGRWNSCDDAYAIRYTAAHLIGALALFPARRKGKPELLDQLAALLLDPAYMQRRTADTSIESLDADLEAALEQIPESHQAFQPLNNRLRLLRGEQVESGARRFINIEIGGYDPTEPLRPGDLYTLVLSVEDLNPDEEITPTDGEDRSQMGEISVEIFSSEFSFFTQRQLLRVPRRGRSRGRARFDFEASTDGVGQLVALITREGNFLQAIELKFSREMPVQINTYERDIDALFFLPPRPLSFILLPADKHYRYLFSGEFSGSGLLPLTIDQMDDWMQRYEEALLEPAGSDPDEDQLPEGVVHEFYQKFSKINQSFLEALFKPETRKLLMNAIDTLAEKESFPLQIYAPGMPLPWNLLYLEDPDRQMAKDRQLGYRHSLELLPGLSDLPGFDPLMAADRQPRIVICASAENHSNQDHIKTLMDELSNLNVKLLTKASELSKNLTRSGPTDILYLHGEAELNQEDHQLKALHFGGGNVLNISAFLKRAAKTGVSGHPLVIVNASLTPRSLADLAERFVQVGARGVVAPVGQVPDRLAQEWGKRVFLDLRAGLPLGIALTNAQNQLLSAYNNPLGLLYHAYADLDTRFTGQEPA